MKGHGEFFRREQYKSSVAVFDDTSERYVTTNHSRHDALCFSFTLMLDQAIWSVQNGLGTFFGSLSGGRLSKREVTQGPQSRAERQKRKKKKSKKKKSG